MTDDDQAKWANVYPIDPPGALVPVESSPAAPDALTVLRHGLAQLDDQRAALAEAGDLDTLAAGLVALTALSRDLRVLTQAVEGDVARLMPAKRHEIPGLGVLERRKGTDRKAWDWDALLPLLIRSYVDPSGTGEMPDAAEVMDRMRELIVDVIGVTPSKGPRVTPLKEMGIDPDEYAETTPARTSVQIHGEK